jgi:hypothetical protein
MINHSSHLSWQSRRKHLQDALDRECWLFTEPLGEKVDTVGPMSDVSHMDDQGHSILGKPHHPELYCRLAPIKNRLILLHTRGAPQLSHAPPWGATNSTLCMSGRWPILLEHRHPNVNTVVTVFHSALQYKISEVCAGGARVTPNPKRRLWTMDPNRILV